MRYGQCGNKVCGRKPNSTAISKHMMEGTESIAACFVCMVSPKRAHDGTSAPPEASEAWRTQRWQSGSS